MNQGVKGWEAKMDKIILRQLSVMARHGVYPEEKRTPQFFTISATCYTDFAPAIASDDVADAINYGELAARIVREVEETSFNLIESLADHLAKMILSDTRIKQVTLRVEKSGAQFDNLVFPAAVEITRFSGDYHAEA